MKLEDLSEYIINFAGLKQGFHSMEFLINSSFFEEMQSDEKLDVEMRLDIEIEKNINLLVFKFHFSGFMNTQCDRCGDDVSLPLNFSETLYVKITDRSENEEDINVVTLATNEYQIDIHSHVYEFIMVHLPFRRIHGVDIEGKSLCNEAALKFLEEKEKTDIDPRWEALKKLKSDN